MSTNHTPGFVPSMLLNAESLLSGHPLNEKTGLTPLEAELLTRALDAVIPVMHTPPEGSTIADAQAQIAGRLLPLNAPEPLERFRRELEHAAAVTGEPSPTAAELGMLADALAKHYAPKPTVAEAFAAVKRASLHNVKRRPLVMKFHGSLSAAELKRRFELIGLQATSDCCGDVCVRELSPRRSQLEAMREEIVRLEPEVEEIEDLQTDRNAPGDNHE